MHKSQAHVNVPILSFSAHDNSCPELRSSLRAMNKIARRTAISGIMPAQRCMAVVGSPDAVIICLYLDLLVGRDRLLYLPYDGCPEVRVNMYRAVTRPYACLGHSTWA
jgi:hypothetical protein